MGGGAGMATEQPMVPGAVDPGPVRERMHFPFVAVPHEIYRYLAAGLLDRDDVSAYWYLTDCIDNPRRPEFPGTRRMAEELHMDRHKAQRHIDRLVQLRLITRRHTRPHGPVFYERHTPVPAESWGGGVQTHPRVGRKRTPGGGVQTHPRVGSTETPGVGSADTPPWGAQAPPHGRDRDLETEKAASASPIAPTDSTPPTSAHGQPRYRRTGGGGDLASLPEHEAADRLLSRKSFQNVLRQLGTGTVVGREAAVLLLADPDFRAGRLESEAGKFLTLVRRVMDEHDSGRDRAAREAESRARARETQIQMLRDYLRKWADGGMTAGELYQAARSFVDGDDNLRVDPNELAGLVAEFVPADRTEPTQPGVDVEQLRAEARAKLTRGRKTPPGKGVTA